HLRVMLARGLFQLRLGLQPFVNERAERVIREPQRLAALMLADQVAQFLLGISLLPVKGLVVVTPRPIGVASQEYANHVLLALLAFDDLAEVVGLRLALFCPVRRLRTSLLRRLIFVGVVGHWIISS